MNVNYSWAERDDPRQSYIEITLTVTIDDQKFIIDRRIDRLVLDYAHDKHRLIEHTKEEMVRAIGYAVANEIHRQVKL